MVETVETAATNCRGSKLSALAHDALLPTILTVTAFVIGGMCGMLGGLALGNKQKLLQVIEVWQPLIGSILALIAAGATVWIIHRQIQSSEKGIEKQIEAQKNVANEQRRRKQLASRAVLPSDLSTICDYVKQSVSVALGGIEACAAGNAGAPTQLAPPVLPERVLANLQNLIEHLDSPTAEVVADLLACYQIQHARLTETLDRFASSRIRTAFLTISFKDSFQKTVELYLRTLMLFPFSRREIDHADRPVFNDSDVRRAITLLQLSNHLNSRETKQLIDVVIRASRGQ